LSSIKPDAAVPQTSKDSLPESRYKTPSAEYYFSDEEIKTDNLKAKAHGIDKSHASTANLAGADTALKMTAKRDDL
jgi:hypothetical protein